MDPIFEKVLADKAGRPGQIIIAEEPWSYGTGRSAIALAVLGTATYRIQVQGDADFLIEKTAFFADLAGAAVTEQTRVVPNITAQVFYTGSKTLWSIAQPIDSVFGRGSLPFIWSRPFLIPAASLMEIAVLSFEAVSTPFLSFSFHGRKIYWGKPEQRTMRRTR